MQTCPKCGFYMITESTRVDYPGLYYSIYEDREYPKVEAHGMPTNLRYECQGCGWKIPIMPNRYYILSK